MNEQTLKALDALAAKLGTTAQYLWAVLVKQAAIEVWTNAAWITVAVIWIAIWLRYVKPVWVWADSADGSEGIGAAFIFAGGVMSALLLCIALTCIFELPTLIGNPEYWALKEVLSSLE